MLRRFTVAIVAVLATGLVSNHAQAQAGQDTTLARRCQEAQRQLTAGPSTPQFDRAVMLLALCEPATQGRAIADAVMRYRTSADTVLLEKLWNYSLWVSDAAIFDMAMRIAADRAASVPSRVYAIRGLALLTHPDRTLLYRNLVGGWSEGTIRIARGGCGFGYSPRYPAAHGTPLPDGWTDRVYSLRVRLINDTTAPLDVQTAATCI
jgi:hypothetical protein